MMGYVARPVYLWIILLYINTVNCDSWVFSSNETRWFELNATAQSVIEGWSDYYYGYPDECRKDLCFQDSSSGWHWHGKLDWPQTRVGVTRYVNCTYTYLNHGVASRDCILVQDPVDGVLKTEWGPLDAADCPGTPVNESLRFIKARGMSQTVAVDDGLAVLCEGLRQNVEGNDLLDFAAGVEATLQRSIQVYQSEGQTINEDTLNNFLCVADRLLRHGRVANTTEFYNNILSLAGLVDESVVTRLSLSNVFFESRSLLVAPTIYATHTVDFRETYGNKNATVIASIVVEPRGSRVQGGAQSRLIAFPKEVNLNGKAVPDPSRRQDSPPDLDSTQDEQGNDSILEYSVFFPGVWHMDGVMVFQAFRLNDQLQAASSLHLSLPVPDQADNPDGFCGGASYPLTVNTDDRVEFLTDMCKCAPDWLQGKDICTCHPPDLVLFAQFYEPLTDATSCNGDRCETETQIPQLPDSIGTDVYLKFPYNHELAIVEEVLRAISLVCLLITVLSYAIFSKTRRGTVTTILIHLCISIIAVILIFYISDEVSASFNGCIAANVLRTYFVLVSLMWNGVEAFNMYLRLIKVFDSKVEKFIIKAALIAWGVPLIPIIIAFAVDTHAFDGGFVKCDFLCSPAELTLYLAFLLPMCLIIVHNLVIFGLVMKQISGRQVHVQKDQKRNRVIQLIGAITMLALLGVPWIFSVFGVIDGNLSQSLKVIEGVFQTIFVVLMNSQGIFIFLFHCLRIPEVRSQWKTSVSKITSTISLVSETPGESMSEKPRVQGKGAKAETTGTSSKQKTETSNVL